jgi:putative FmdB family regulatory protein
VPRYDYCCQDCGRRFTLFYKTYAEYDAATPHCPHCGSLALTRVIKGVRTMHSEESRLDSLESMAGLDAFDDLENADPRTLGRMMRHMSQEMGEDVGPEFDEVVGRLEAGESPESIEEEMGDVLDETAGEDAAFGAG